MANVIDDKVRDSKSVSKGKNINIIVATSTNYGIGYENKMCWNIPNELKYFKNTKFLKKEFIFYKVDHLFSF